MSPFKSTLFADDTSFIFSSKNATGLTQVSELIDNKALQWFSAHRLKLNSEKTQRLQFSAAPHTNMDSVKMLGITLDNKLSWVGHTSALKKKLSSCLFLLRQLKNITNAETLKITYFSLFHSQINYGLIIWGNSSTAINIFRMQKKAVRIMAKVSYLEHCRPLFKQFGIMPLPSLYIFNTLIEIHSRYESIEKQSDVHEYDTRHANNIRMKKFRLTKSQKNTLNYQLYNILPHNIKNSSKNKFKKIIKSFLNKYCFYTVQEYLDCIKSSPSGIE